MATPHRLLGSISPRAEDVRGGDVIAALVAATGPSRTERLRPRARGTNNNNNNITDDGVSRFAKDVHRGSVLVPSDRT